MKYQTQARFWVTAEFYALETCFEPRVLQLALPLKIGHMSANFVLIALGAFSIPVWGYKANWYVYFTFRKRHTLTNYVIFCLLFPTVNLPILATCFVTTQVDRL